MCELADNKGNIWQGQKKYRLADFFDWHWDTYSQSPKTYIRPEQYDAVNAIRVCRTEKLGVEHYVCTDCGEVTEIYHSCQNRFCPTCSWKDTMKWAETIEKKMFKLPHRHVVFTLPHKLNGLIKENGKHLLNILMRESADVLKDWMASKYNIKPGIISVLHTYGEQKNFHVHVHMIVSWGGINMETKQLEQIKGEYVNFKFLQNKYRIKFEDALVEMFDNDELKHHFRTRIDFMRFLRQVNVKNWHLHLEPPMQIPTEVIRYIGRYSKRACLSEYKITKMEGDVIAFSYKDYRNKDFYGKPIVNEEELDYYDFIPRLLQHVPLKRFRLVRYYGHYAGASKIPAEYIFTEKENTETDNNIEQIQVNENSDNTQEVEDLRTCVHCHKEKKYLYTVFLKKDNTIFKVQEDRLLRNKEFREKYVA